MTTLYPYASVSPNDQAFRKCIKIGLNHPFRYLGLSETHYNQKENSTIMYYSALLYSIVILRPGTHSSAALNPVSYDPGGNGA